MTSPGPTTVFLALALAVAPSLGAAPSIVHVGLECIAPGRFAVVLSGIDPGSEIQTAKVYFRSELYPDFYYVLMKLDGDRFVGILPQTAPETPRVIYYLEAVDQTYESVRSEEFAPVVGECDDDPALAYLAGGTPEIVVGATTAGMAALPPGFAAAGIVGTIAATGAASGVAAGIGTGAVVAGAAGAAGAAAAVVVATQGETSTSTTVAAAPPTSSVTTSAPAGGGSPSTSSTTTVTPGSTTTIIATTTVPGGSTTTSTPGGPTSSTTSTTTVPGGSTTTSTPGGPTTSTTSTTTSSSSTTTSSSSTTTTTVSPLNAGCFTVEIKGPCHVKVNAQCVDDPVDRRDWVLDTQNKFSRVDIPDGGTSESHQWSGADCNQNETITFRLTVYRGASSSTAEKTVLVPASLTALSKSEPAELQLQTRLDLSSPDDRSRVRILVDGRLAGTLVAGQPLSFRSLLSPGPHEIEGVVLRSPGEPGLWSLDFGGTSGFREGSLRVVQGNVLAMGPRRVTLRIGGEPEERVRIRFELE